MEIESLVLLPQTITLATTTASWVPSTLLTADYAIEQKAPVISGQVTRPECGWHSGNVTVTFSCIVFSARSNTCPWKGEKG